MSADASGEDKQPNSVSPSGHEKGDVLERLPVIATSDAEIPSRRNFLQQYGGVAIATLSCSLTTAGLFLTRESLRLTRDNIDLTQKEIRDDELQRRKTQQELIFKLLFGDSKKQYYVPSFDNPYAALPPGSITAPTQDALNSIFDHVGFDEHHIKELTETNPTKIDGSILLLGGPVPNKLSRAILGRGQGSPLFSAALGRPIQLPIYFGNILVGKVGPGHRPKYQVVVDGRSLGTAEDGTEDYLVITSIPNVCSVNFQSFKHRLVNVAGLHGGGMRGIDLVLKDQFLPKFIKEIEERPELKGAPAWQAIVCIELDPNDKSKPRRITDHGIHRIRMSDSDFDRVRSHVLRSGIRI